MDIKWENPPSAQRLRAGSHDELSIADTLRQNPNTWARVMTYDKPTTAGAVAQQIRSGQRASFRAGFEAKSRTVEGEYCVYVRFTG